MTVELARRPSVYTLPSYSLTSDLLGFLRCGLQYRYERIGRLPSTHPVQLWFGQFIHGVLEEAYRRYDEKRRQGTEDPPPWSLKRIAEIIELIKRRLAAQGLFAWDPNLEQLGDHRAVAAINHLGPALFPLIHRAEVRLTGSRILPVDKIPAKYRFREADRYEMVGVIDVITHVELVDSALADNTLVQSIVPEIGHEPPDRFELIVDYKGMRRPPLTSPEDVAGLWQIYAWQVQTYAHLRSTHEDALPVVAGLIIYLNELCPTREDLVKLKREAAERTTDIAPPQGSDTARLLSGWRKKDDLPYIPIDFRLRRALRVVPVTPKSVAAALQKFDGVVAQIETCRGREVQEGRVIPSWDKNPADESTCTACSSKTYCPDYTKESRPRLPGVRA